MIDELDRQKVEEIKKLQAMQRASYGSFFNRPGIGIEGSGYGNSSFFDPGMSIINTGSTSQSQEDYRIDPQEVADNFNRAITPLGIYSRITSLLRNRQWGFFGKNPKKNKMLKELLCNSIDMQDAIYSSFLPAFFGSGDGNALGYTVKKSNGDIEIRLDGFFKAGFCRIGYRIIEDCYIDTYHVMERNKIDPLHNFRAKDVFHFKYANPHADVLGLSPALVLSPLWKLKWRMLAANETIYTNGLQASKLISFESPFKDDQRIFDLFEQEKARIIGQLKQGEGLGNRNSSIITWLDKIKVDDMQLKNGEMETLGFMGFFEKQQLITYGLDPAFTDLTNSKYNDAEIIRDMANKAIQGQSGSFEDFVKYYAMPKLFSQYNPDKDPFRFGVDPTAEELDMYELRTGRVKSQSEILVNLAKAGGGYTLDFETMEIVKIEEPKVAQEVVNEITENKEEVAQNAADVKEEVADLVEEQRSKMDKAKDIVAKAMTKQFETLPA